MINTLLPLPLCFAQELCDAGTLQQAVVQGHFGGSKDTSAERAKCRALLKTAREVASGMQHLHSLGIIRECSLEGWQGEGLLVPLHSSGHKRRGWVLNSLLFLIKVSVTNSISHGQHQSQAPTVTRATSHKQDMALACHAERVPMAASPHLPLPTFSTTPPPPFALL